MEAIGTPFVPPPPASSGVSIWLVVANPGRGIVALDAETEQSLKALGYLR